MVERRGFAGRGMAGYRNGGDLVDVLDIAVTGSSKR